ncbi:3-oxoacyl-ACP synthase III family protein [Dactylosporangium sp. CA-233914]|uniref:3-oxoacyl-ACP synthase III family protein n=1 Tax=Dactylosporangium sp. CA-233914 TaxID=3239934 RepID=UPI003D94C2CD
MLTLPDTAVAVLGTGVCLPDQVVGNDTVAGPAGVTAEWVARKTGIRTRRWAKPDQATSDLAVAAGRAALEDAGVRAGELSLVLVATSTPDSPQPPTASLVADELGVRPGTVAFDLNAVCSGFVFALATAARLLRGPALVIGADVYSRILDPTERRTAVLFGDGAGAMVLGPGEPSLLAARLATFPEAHPLIRVPAGGSRIPASADSIDAGLHYFAMEGRAVRDFVLDTVAPGIRDFLRDAGVRAEGLAAFVPHQANPNLVADLAAAVGVSAGRTAVSGAEVGNTGAASVPIALHHARAGLRPGDLVLLAGFGGGMSAGFALLRWPGPGRSTNASR